MPQIPTYTAQGKAVEQDYPRDVPVEDFSGLSATGGQLQRTSQQVGQIADYYNQAEQKINALKVKNNVIGVTAGYQEGLVAIEEKIRMDGTIRDRGEAETKFREEEKILRADAFKSAETPAAKFELDNYIKGNFGKSVNKVRHLGNEKATAYNVGQLELNADRLRSLAAQEPDIDTARRYRAEYESALRLAKNSGHINELKYQQELIKFDNGVYSDKADILLNGDNGPEMFRAAVRNGIFGELNEKGQWEGYDLKELTNKALRASEIEHTKSVRERQEHNIQETKVKRQWDILNHSAEGIPAEWMAAAKRGDNPYILPKEAEVYEKDRLFPPNPQADLAVRTLRQEYRSNPVISEERVAEFSRRAKELGIRGQNQELSQFYNELQSDTTSAKNLTIQATNRAVTRGKEAVRDAIRSPVIPGASRMNTFLRSLDAQAQHEVDKAAREARNAGKNAEEIEIVVREKIAEIQKKKADAINKIPDDKKKRFRIYED